MALALLLLGTGNVRAAESYSLTVVPQFDQRKLFAIWSPIAAELSRRAGLELRLETTLSVPEFEAGLSAGRFDFVYASPYQVFRERDRQAYLPLVEKK